MMTILLSAVLAVAVFVVAWAWVDGGRRPLRTIVETVRPQDMTVPAGTRS